MGGLLGDSTIQRRSSESYRLKITHSFRQKAYVLWKHKKLIQFCQTTQPPKEYVERKKSGTEYRVVSFSTSSDARLKHIQSYN